MNHRIDFRDYAVLLFNRFSSGRGARSRARATQLEEDAPTTRNGGRCHLDFSLNSILSPTCLFLLRVPFTPKLNFYLLIYSLPKIFHQDNK